ncbi:hypothetical protein [Mesobacterium pallidum]|uniref:hypothetical protein n=1 Tax=Mesobacterium pallidum TaxID=2872037 RepID=UPI001EE3497A|nr:hypothetical protein [Mesobacterium pallidum]
MSRLLHILILLPTGLGSQALPTDFDSCLDLEIARFERNLRYHRLGPEADSFEVGTTRGTQFCGTVGIANCDLSEDRAPCQHDLAARQDAVTDHVRATLPAPDAVAGKAGAESDLLYPQLYALAFDLSAGPDCAGDTDLMAAWCQARNANHRLGSAVLAWQMARYLGAAPDAITAGWAKAPPATRPRARNE